MVGLIVAFIIVVPIAIMWTLGISKMKDDYPDYRGEDFLN